MKQLEMFEDTYTPHSAQFYEGVPIEVFRSALERPTVLPKKARFWFHSKTPRMCWIVGWECKGDSPSVYFVNVAHIAISREASDPPPMPEWATNPIDPSWIFERLHCGR